MGLKHIAKKYTDLIHNIGQADDLVLVEKEAPILWADRCKKILNDGAMYEDGKEFLPQLVALRDMAGKWKIKPLFITAVNFGDAPCPKCDVLYELYSEKMGNYRTSARLTFDGIKEDAKIIRIDEVVESIG